MPKNYTAALIGLGGFSRTHMRGYSMVPQVRVVAACDINPAKHEWWAEQVKEVMPGTPVRYYTDAAAMLAAEKPDLVSITTKHDQHAPLTILCAQAGVKGIICEKPMAMNLGEADAMLKACAKSGTKLAIGHQRRFNQEWIAGRKMIQKGAIGRVLHAISRWPSDKPEMYTYDIFGGGPLMFLSIHSIDLLRYILGEVAWVTAQVDIGVEGGDCESRAYALLGFKGGAQAVVECGPGIGPAATIGHSVVFYGEGGTVHVCDGRGTRYKTSRQPQWREVKLDKDTLPWQIGSRCACRDQVKDLIRCIERDQTPRCDGRQGRADLEVVMAIYEAERTGGKVKLPLKKKTSPLLEMTRTGGFGEVTWKPDPAPAPAPAATKA